MAKKQPAAKTTAQVDESPAKYTVVAPETIAFHLDGAFMRVRAGDVVEGKVAEAVKAAGAELA
jgi:hypothetical protein